MSSIGSVSGSNAGYYRMQQEIFTKTDADGDGSISQSELVAARPKGVSEEDAQKLYASIDTEGKGSISFEQFSAIGEAPESKLTGAAVDALLQIGAQGGMTPSAIPDATETFYSIDTDGDGSITQAEFLAGKPDDMTDDQASALFEALDTEGTGAVTEDQFVQQLDRSSGRPPMGPPPGGESDEEKTDEVFDALDTNQDGVVSEAEFLAAKPDGMTEDQVSALFDALDTEGTGSISKDQFAESLSQMQRRPMGPPPGDIASAQQSGDLLTVSEEDTATASV